MFRFEHPVFLYTLLVLPILAGLFFWARRRRDRQLARMGNPQLIQRLSPGISPVKPYVKLALLLLSLAFLIVGWANPQWGAKLEKVKRKSSDVFIALDISSSMLCNDISPNRLERAKRFTQQLVENLKGERIGLILFAGSSYLQMPLTTDYAAAMLFIRSATPESAPTQGTNLAEAIELADRSFEETNKNHKVLVVVSDGEAHDGEAAAAAENAYKNGLLIFTVGLGTDEGGFIPAIIGGRSDFKRDQNGEPVKTRIEEAALQAVPQSGKGAYFRLGNDAKDILTALKSDIDKVEKRELEERRFSEYESYFQYFLAIGLLLLLAEWTLSSRRGKWWESRDFFG